MDDRRSRTHSREKKEKKRIRELEKTIALLQGHLHMAAYRQGPYSYYKQFQQQGGGGGGVERLSMLRGQRKSLEQDVEALRTYLMSSVMALDREAREAADRPTPVQQITYTLIATVVKGGGKPHQVASHVRNTFDQGMIDRTKVYFQEPKSSVLVQQTGGRRGGAPEPEPDPESFLVLETDSEMFDRLQSHLRNNLKLPTTTFTTASHPLSIGFAELKKIRTGLLH